MTKDELYEKHKFLVYKVIKDLGCKFRTDDEYEEYVFWGELGLVKAINKYNENQFTSSAFFYISIRNSVMLLFQMKTSHKRKINYMDMESLDSPILNTKYYTEFHEIIPDENVNVEEEVIKKSQYETLYKAIDMLKPDYKNIICGYYGIKQKPMILDELAKKYGVTSQAIHLKKANALRDLKKIMIRMGETNAR